MRLIKQIIAVILAIVIISFFAPYCTSGDGDAKLKKMYNIYGLSNSWKWLVIWGIIIFGGMFIYSVIIEDPKKK